MNETLPRGAETKTVGKERSKAIGEPITRQIGGRRGQGGRERKEKKVCVEGSSERNGRRGASIHSEYPRFNFPGASPTSATRREEDDEGRQQRGKTYLSRGGIFTGSVGGRNYIELLNLDDMKTILFIITIFFKDFPLK